MPIVLVFISFVINAQSDIQKECEILGKWENVVFVQYLEKMNLKNMIDQLYEVTNMFTTELLNAVNLQYECISLVNVPRDQTKLKMIEDFFAQNIHAKFSVQENNVFFQSTHGPGHFQQK